MSGLKCNCKKFKVGSDIGKSMPQNEQPSLTVIAPLIIRTKEGKKKIERYKCPLCKTIYTKESYAKVRRETLRYCGSRRKRC